MRSGKSTPILLFLQYAQTFFSKSLSLKINDDSLACILPCKAITVSFTLSNDSDDDILVYGLVNGGPGPSFKDLSPLCDVTRTGTGIQFALYRTDGTQNRAEFEISDRFGQRPVTKEMVDSTFRQMRVDFLKSAMIIKGHEKKTFIKQVPLHNFQLERELYYLQMVYYCGNKTSETLDLKEIGRSGAKLFQGCTSSARIPFVVN